MTSESIPVPPTEMNTSGEKATVEAVPAQRTDAQEWYARLDRFLLYWTAGELGYLILLILGLIVLLIIGFTDSSVLNSLSPETLILYPCILLVVAMLVNLGVGFTGLVFNIITRHPGYPGTGHLLNWIFLFAFFWLFVILFIVALPNMFYSVF